MVYELQEQEVCINDLEKVIAAQGGKVLKKVKIPDDSMVEVLGCSSSIIEYTVEKANGTIECFNVAVYEPMEDEDK